ncbi:MAG: type II secretion system F family protein [Lachnospiraceae bacterium]|nr:type II secretion system F family protein [Lachnospiraceae bacterium]
MATFGYLAVDNTGRDVKGSLEGDSEDQVRAKLKNDGLTVIEISEQSAWTKDISIGGGGARPKARDFSVFCRQFVAMTRAGVTIIDSLHMLSEQTENKRLQKAIRDTQVNVEKGETLSDSMEEQKIFPELLLHMTKAGESSGALDIAFERMATQFEKDAKVQAMLKKALIYPIIVVIVAIGVVTVMLTFVIPNYTEMFADMEMELPVITKVVVAMSDFVMAKWYLLVAAVVAFVFAYRAFRATPGGRHILDKLALKDKLMGDLRIKSASARFARTLSTMLAAGISMVDALEITGGTLDNVILQDAISKCREDVVQGVPLSKPLEDCGMFPPMVYHMTRIGEETGDIEGLLTKLAEYYEEEVEMATESLMAVMEPLIIVVLAGIVGVLIGAVMAPMLSMYQGLDNL